MSVRGRHAVCMFTLCSGCLQKSRIVCLSLFQNTIDTFFLKRMPLSDSCLFSFFSFKDLIAKPFVEIELELEHAINCYRLSDACLQMLTEVLNRCKLLSCAK